MNRSGDRPRPFPLRDGPPVPPDIAAQRRQRRHQRIFNVRYSTLWPLSH